MNIHECFAYAVNLIWASSGQRDNVTVGQCTVGKKQGKYMNMRRDTVSASVELAMSLNCSFLAQYPKGSKDLWVCGNVSKSETIRDQVIFKNIGIILKYVKDI